MQSEVCSCMNLAVLRNRFKNVHCNHVATQLIRKPTNICDPDSVLANSHFLNICSTI